MIVRAQDFFVTEVAIDPKLSADKVFAFMKERGTTGPITVNLSQGGTQSIAVTERKRLTDSQSRQIREILGIE